MCRALTRHAGARIEQRARKVLSRRWRQKHAPRWRSELAVCSCELNHDNPACHKRYSGARDMRTD